GCIARNCTKLAVHIVNDAPVPREQGRPPARGQTISHVVDDRRTTTRHVGGVVENRIAQENEVLAHRRRPCVYVTQLSGCGTLSSNAGTRGPDDQNACSRPRGLADRTGHAGSGAVGRSAAGNLVST